jgi:hypothetical protein
MLPQSSRPRICLWTYSITNYCMAAFLQLSLWHSRKQVKTSDSLASDNVVQNSEWNLWKCRGKFYNFKGLSFTNFSVNTFTKMITHYRWPPDQFALHLEQSLAHLWRFYPIVSQCRHQLTFGRKPRSRNLQGISVALMCLARRNRITVNFAAVSITDSTHCVETRTNSRWPIMWWFRRQWVMWRCFACANSLSLSLTRCYSSCQTKRRLLSEWPRHLPSFVLDALRLSCRSSFKMAVIFFIYFDQTKNRLRLGQPDAGQSSVSSHFKGNICSSSQPPCWLSIYQSRVQCWDPG